MHGLPDYLNLSTWWGWQIAKVVFRAGDFSEDLVSVDKVDLCKPCLTAFHPIEQIHLPQEISS
jgi:hypothetical protein